MRVVQAATVALMGALALTVPTQVASAEPGDVTIMAKKWVGVYGSVEQCTPERKARQKTHKILDYCAWHPKQPGWLEGYYFSYER